MKRALGIRLVVIAAALLGAVVSEVAGQALTPMRNWTSSDGKVTQAELLVFQPGADNNTVRLRLKDGSVFKIGLERFSREDQAVILKARLESQFRVKFNTDQTSCQFFSKHLAADDWKNRTYAYFGSDTNGSWLRLAMNQPPGRLSKAVAVVIIGEGVPLRIPLEEGSVRGGRRGRTSFERFDIDLGERSADFLRVLKHRERLQVFLEIPGADHQPISLTDKEKRGLRAVGEAFETVSDLSTDKTWWATLIGRDRDELIAEEADRLRQFRDPNREALIAMRPWSTVKGDTIEAEVLGFVGPDAVFRDIDGNVNAYPAAGFVAADLEQLSIRRLETTLVRSWHPVDDTLDYYWPIAWENDRRFRHQAVLLAVERGSRKPRIVLQQVFDGDPELAPAAVEIRGAEMPEGLRLPLIDPLKVRGNSGVRVWIPLDEMVANVFVGLIRESEGIDYVLESSELEVQTGTLAEDEFAAAVEAVELYRMFSEWRAMTESPVPAGISPEGAPETEPAPEPEPAPAESDPAPAAEPLPAVTPPSQ